MNLISFIKIIIRKIGYVFLLPLAVAILVFILTGNLPLQYEAETTVFTGITSNTGLALQDARVDNLATQNEYNNILSILSSKSILEETSLRLLTQHLMLDKPQKDIISEDAFAELQEQVPSEVKRLIVKGDAEKSYQNLVKYIKPDEQNYLYRLLNYSHPHYSLEALSNIKSNRVSTSDIVQISYQTNDPGICYNTVKIIAENFIKNYSKLKNNQSSSAVEYFEKKLKEANLKLMASEDQLLKFNTDNDIINYYEQTEQVTTQLEKIEIKLQDTKMEYQAAEAVLQKLEKEVGNRFKINLRNSHLMSVRQELVDCNNEIAKLEFSDNPADFARLNAFKQTRHQLESKLELKLDSLYSFESNSQGIEAQSILNEWLTSVKNYESYNAQYKSMLGRRVEFLKEFKKYAPLGATLKRNEREIDVNEGEYLNTLQHLGVARQKLQNSDMVTNMKIMDEPGFPITSLPSKRKMFVILAALFTLIFYIAGLFIIELLDQTIKTPTRLKLFTGLEVPAAYCEHDSRKFINTESITQKSTLYLYELMREISTGKNKPVILQMLSNWPNAGKKSTSQLIKQVIERNGQSCTIYDLTESESGEAEKKEKMDLYIHSTDYTTLIQRLKIDTDYLISIIPPVNDGLENSVIIPTADLSLMFFNANVTWSEADGFNLEKVKKLINNNLFAVLTKAYPDNLEEIYGEIPKKRSKLRIQIKKLISKFSK